MTRTEILALEIFDALNQATRDIRIQPSALRCTLNSPISTTEGIVIQIEIKTNKGKLETYHLTLEQIS